MNALQSKPGASSATLAVEKGLYMALSSRWSALLTETLAISVSSATIALALAAGLGQPASVRI